jgi:hypothetical protein
MKDIHHPENSGHPLRLALKTMVIFLFLALLMLLVAAWLVSDPLLKTLNGFSRKILQKIGHQNIKGRFFINCSF